MSGEVCQKAGIPLPQEQSTERKYSLKAPVRSMEEIWKRSAALYLISTYSDGLLQRNCSHDESRAYIQKFITKFSADSYFSEKEREFLENSDPSDSDIGHFCWRWESLYFLLWSSGFVKELGLPTKPCQTFSCARVFNRHRTLDAFSKASAPPPFEEVVEMANFLDTLAAEKEAKFDEGVFTEWSHAAKWLLTECEWDE